MFKKLLVIFTILIPFLPTCAKTFMGIEEFATKSDAKKILQDSYGVLDIIENGSDIDVVNPSFAGFDFSLASLHFTPIEGISRFNGLTLQRWFDPTQVKVAKEFRDRVMNALNAKYKDQLYVEFVNDQGFKCSEFGINNNGSIGSIELNRLKGKDGKERLYVFLYYFPFDRKAIEDEL